VGEQIALVVEDGGEEGNEVRAEDDLGGDVQILPLNEQVWEVPVDEGVEVETDDAEPFAEVVRKVVLFRAPIGGCGKGSRR